MVVAGDAQHILPHDAVRIRRNVGHAVRMQAPERPLRRHGLLLRALVASGRQHVDKGEAALHGLADLVEEVAVEAVERADDPEIARQRHRHLVARVGRHHQRAALAAERGQQAAERGVDRRASELVYH